MSLISGFFLLIVVTIWFITGRLNTYVTLHVHYNTDAVHLQADYNSDTLQGALIHTTLYTFTMHLQADYNSGTLQDA